MIDVGRGDGPLILGLPHGGTEVPPDIWARLNETGQGLADTDWHIGRLYEGLGAGATRVGTRIHRYVIDCNRPPDGESLYPGQATTGLVPGTDFDGRPIWRDGAAPNADEIADRVARFHRPYHAALEAEIARVRAKWGVAILYDCHSIRSEVPRLFPDTLPIFNIGTNSGRSCNKLVEELAEDACAAAAPAFDHVSNGRFKGGWTTRHHGRPAEGVHALQMELAQRAYMQEAPPWRWDAARAEAVRPVLDNLLRGLEALGRRLADRRGPESDAKG